MIAHFHAKEMSGGDAMEFAFGVFALFVEAGGVVVVAIYGIEIPVIKLLALGIGIGDTLLDRPGEQVVEGGDVGESPRAFGGYEKVTRLDVGDTLVGMELEEFLTGGRTAQEAQHAELAVMDIGNVGAPIRARGL